MTRGEGRAFPRFTPGELARQQDIPLFDQERPLTCTVGHGYSILASFEAGYRRSNSLDLSKVPEHIQRSSSFIREEGLLYPAPRYQVVPGPDGAPAVQAEGLWAEEGQIVTLKTSAPGTANALTFQIKADFPSARGGNFALNLDGKPGHAVDLVVFVAPAGKEFPWASFAPTDELREALARSGYTGPGRPYEYLISTDRKGAAVRVPDLTQAGDFGLYVARRYVTAGEWSTCTVPLADFICYYGQGACQAMQRQQLPLASDTVAAVGWLAPFGSGHGTLSLQKPAWAQVPGEPAQLRSFWQVPEAQNARLTPVPFYRQYQGISLMTLGAEEPAFPVSISAPAP